jgi:tetratricopeptide (TPR) repeat protein
MAQKRISRARKRDLEQPDEFLTLTARMLEQVRTYWKPVSAAGVVLLLILAGVLAFDYFNKRAEDQAFVQLNKVMYRYAAELSSQDAPKAIDAVTPDFETLFAHYEKRQGGAAGRLIFAQMNYRAGRPEAAVVQYEAAVKLYPEGTYGASAAWDGLGYAFAATDQYEKAIGAFKKVVDGQDAVLKSDALYQLTLLYRKTGKKVDYEKALQTLKNHYPGFIYAEMLPGATGS